MKFLWRPSWICAKKMNFACIDFSRLLVYDTGNLTDIKTEEKPYVAICGGSSSILTGLKRRSGDIPRAFFATKKMKSRTLRICVTAFIFALIFIQLFQFSFFHHYNLRTSWMSLNSVSRYSKAAKKILAKFVVSSVQDSKDWKGGSFCHDYFVKTFQVQIPVCDIVANSSIQCSIKCYGSKYSKKMGTCTLENLVISPRILEKMMLGKSKKSKLEQSIGLLADCGTECHNMRTDSLRKNVEKGDYLLKLVEKIRETDPLNSSVCDKWIEDDVLLFTSQASHIYFRFLDYFNIHKTLQDFNHTLTNRIHIIRIPLSTDRYLFPAFDQALFPEGMVQTLDTLDGDRICFKRVILVPRAVSSFLFRCKMNPITRRNCLNCNGRGLKNTQISSFRNRVLNACSLSDHRNDSVTDNGKNYSITFVSRKPYTRYKGDKKENFLRMMENENELEHELKNTFKSSAAVHTVHLEDLEICDQVSLVYNSDVYLGVHGAGLVHLWWLKEDSLVYEMEPISEVGNPTFHTLAQLTGHKYKSVRIKGGKKLLHANVRQVVNDLFKYSTQ